MVPEGEVVSKYIYLMLVLLWHQYVKRGMFFVSRKGTFVKEKAIPPSKGVCLALKYLPPITKLYTHHGEKTVCLVSKYLPPVMKLNTHVSRKKK